jgi:hypothetical protein
MNNYDYWFGGGKMGKKILKKDCKTKILSLRPLISSRNRRSNQLKHILRMSLVILILGSYLGSSMIPIQATLLQPMKNPRNDLNVRTYFFTGTIYNLDKNGQNPSFSSLCVFFSHSLFTSPLNISLFYNDEHLSLENALYFSKEISYNRTFIIGFCERYDVSTS